MKNAEKKLAVDPINQHDDTLIAPAIFISLIVFGMPIIGSITILFHLGG